MEKRNNSFKIQQLILDKQLQSLNERKANPNNIILNSAAFQAQIVKDNPLIRKNPFSKKTSFKPIFDSIHDLSDIHKRGRTKSKNKSNQQASVSNRSQSKDHYSNYDLLSNNKNQVNKQENKDKKLILPNIFKENFLEKAQTQKELFAQNKQFYSNLSLAQKIGLEKINVKPLTKEEWEKLENKIDNRIDHNSSCPICLEKLSVNKSTILSCSHVFHKSCLSSYEKLVKNKSCPICREKNYQQKNYFKDKEKFISFSIILIQKNYKGFRIRLFMYNKYFKNSPPRSKLLKKRYSYFRIRELFAKINNKIAENSNMNDSLFNEMKEEIEKQKLLQDNILKETLLINSKLKKDIKITNNNIVEETIEDKINKDNIWNNLLKKYNTKSNDNCSICLSKFSNKKVYLLDCGHVYHEQCLVSMEKYDNHYVKRCPACRKQEYNKKLLILPET